MVQVLLITLGIALAALIAVKVCYVVGTGLALPKTKGAMFTSTHGLRVERALGALKLAPGETLFDLGCGDGRFLVAAARMGASAVGYEVNGWAWLLARLKTFLFAKGAQVRFGSFWEADISGADAVVCYLFPDVMARLAEKLGAELKPGARVASCNFPLPGWTPEAIIKLDHPRETDPIYLYRKGA